MSEQENEGRVPVTPPVQPVTMGQSVSAETLHDDGDPEIKMENPIGQPAIAEAQSGLKPGWEWLESEELPKPTYWPVVMAVGLVLVALGLLTSLLIIALGVFLFVLSLVGWIGDLHDEQVEQQHG